MTDRFELTARGLVSGRLEALMAARGSQPDTAQLEAISDALDVTRPNNDDPDAWFSAARTVLML